MVERVDVNSPNTPKVNNRLTETFDRFRQSNYATNLTMGPAGVALTLPAGVKYGAGTVKVTNLGVTTEAVRVATGVDEADALANLNMVAGAATTGDYLPSNVDVPGAGIEKYGTGLLEAAIAVGPAVAGKTNQVAITLGV